MTITGSQADNFSCGPMANRGIAPTYANDIIKVPDVAATCLPQSLGQASRLGRTTLVKSSGSLVLRADREPSTSKRKCLSLSSCKRGESELDRSASRGSHGFFHWGDAKKTVNLDINVS